MSAVKWNLRMVAAQRDIWRPTQLMQALSQIGFTPSLSKVAALWSGTPVTVRLDDLDKICAALDCTVSDLLQPEPVAAPAQPQDVQHAVGGQDGGPSARNAYADTAQLRRRSSPIAAAELMAAATRSADRQLRELVAPFARIPAAPLHNTCCDHYASST
jgi:DNA-binding Xre family transcriptional regulator